MKCLKSGITGAVLGVVGLLSVAMCALPGKALAHPDVILQCEKNIKIKQAVMVGEPVQYENGLIGERYDRNGDGKIDIEALSIAHADDDAANPVTGKYVFSHRPFPLFYVVDLDLDGEPDAVYVDRTAGDVIDPKQHCDNVVLYEELNKYRGKENPVPDHQKKNDI